MACTGNNCKSSCNNKTTAGDHAEKIMSAKDIAGTIDNLIFVLQKISDYSLLSKLGLDVTAMQNAVESVRKLIIENEYLRRMLPTTPTPTVTSEANGVTLSFGPENQYKLLLPITQPSARLLLAKQFRDLAKELEQPVSTPNPAQTLFSFLETKPA